MKNIMIAGIVNGEIVAESTCHTAVGARRMLAIYRKRYGASGIVGCRCDSWAECEISAREVIQGIAVFPLCPEFELGGKE